MKSSSRRLSQPAFVQQYFEVLQSQLLVEFDKYRLALNSSFRKEKFKCSPSIKSMDDVVCGKIVQIKVLSH